MSNRQQRSILSSPGMESLSRGQSNISDEDMERLRSILISQGMTPTLSASGRRAPGGVNSPPRTPLMMSFGSDTGVSDGDDSVGGFELPPTLLTGASWTVDPNMNVPENFSLTGVDLTSAQLPEQMIDLMDDYAYWLSVVDRLGFDNKHIFQFDDIPSLEILSRFFDSSHLGLLRVFHIFDKDRDALITRAEIAEGLRQQGFYTHVGSQVADLAFDEFCELLTRRSAHAAAAAVAADAAAAGPPSQLVSPPEFLLSLRCLRLAAVVHGYMYPSRLGVLGDQESDIILNYHEYREDKIWSHLPLEGPISFLYQNAESAESATCRVHWIHSHEPTIRTVLALGVKYGLDPRFTLDILSLWKQKALVDRSLSYVARTRGEDSLFDNPSEVQTFIDREWIFVIIPILRLSEDSAETIVPFNEWRLNDLRKRNDFLEPPPVFIQVETCNLGMFASGRGIGGTIISFTTEWVSHGEVETSNELTPEESILGGYMGISAMSTGSRQPGGQVGKIWDRIWRRKTPQSAESNNMPGGISFGSYKQSSRGDSFGEDIAPGFNEDFRVFSKIMTQLRTAYSHLRTGDAHTLFLKQLCDITEDYVNVIIAYDAALTIIGMRLDDKRDGLDQYEVQRLNACRQQITQMVRAVRPVAIVIDILDARDWGGDSELYLSDVKSNIIKFLDNANGIREKADLLAGQFRNYCDAKTQKVLVILTLVTTLMTPLLFLTSLEGMNFSDMPELKLQYGYLYFWIVCITIVVSVLLFYRKQKWI